VSDQGEVKPAVKESDRDMDPPVNTAANIDNEVCRKSHLSDVDYMAILLIMVYTAANIDSEVCRKSHSSDLDSSDYGIYSTVKRATRYAEKVILHI
jgi:hypothetical protein